jgi:hypothetical protein
MPRLSHWKLAQVLGYEKTLGAFVVAVGSVGRRLRIREASGACRPKLVHRALVDRSLRAADWGRLSRPTRDTGAGIDRPRNLARDTLHIVMGPSAYHCPTLACEGSICVRIASAIRLDLRSPPLGVRFRPRTVRRTAVPEAAVDEDRDAGTREEQVGATPHRGQRRVHAKTKPEPVYGRAQLPLTWCVTLRRVLHAATHGV